MGIQIRGVVIDTNPSRERLDQLGVFSWPIWEKEVSTFDWEYDEPETCFFLEGKVEVQPLEGTHPWATRHPASQRFRAPAMKARSICFRRIGSASFHSPTAWCWHR